MRSTALLSIVIAMGCAVRIPEATFACTSEAQCPSGWRCNGGFCESTSTPSSDAGLDATRIDAAVDAASGTDAATDASFDADIDSTMPDAATPDAGTCFPLGASAVRSLTAFSSTGEDDVPSLTAEVDDSLLVPLQFSGGDLVIDGTTYASAGGIDGLALRLDGDLAVLDSTLYTGTAGGAPWEVATTDGDVVTTGHFTTAITFDGYSPSGSARRSAFLYRDGSAPLTFSSTTGSVFSESLAVNADRICIAGQITGDTSFGGATLTARSGEGFVACFDEALGHLYSFSFGGSTNADRVDDLAMAADGTLYVVGRFAASAGVPFGSRTITSNGLMDGFVARLSPTGDLDWFQNVSTPDTTRDESVMAVAIEGDAVYVGGFLGTGTITGLGPSRSFTTTVAFWARFSAATGAAEWAGFEDSGSGDIVYSIAADGCGHLYVGGGRDSVSPLGPTNVIPFLIALDTSGTERWRLVAGSGRGSIRGLVARPDGRVYGTGPFTGSLSLGSSTLAAARGVSDAFLLVVEP